MFGIAVLMTRPEESLQSVALASWNYMEVQMRDALAYSIVDGEEGSLRSQCLFYCNGQQSCICRQLREQGGGQIYQAVEMLARNHKTVSRKHGTVIKKS